jgi:hypothetical protein
MNNKVLVTNHSGYPYEAAEKFGEIIFMTNGYIKLDDLDKIRSKLVQFIAQTEATDYLVLSGNNVLCALAVLAWKERHGYVNILHWASDRKDYIHYVIQ